MVNMQPGGQGDTQWYPKLPEGYEDNRTQDTSRYANDSWSPGMGTSGQGMQGYDMQAFSPEQDMQGYDTQAFSPEQDMQGHDMQAFSPGQDMSDYGMPEQEMVAYHPRYDTQEFAPPNQGMPGFGPPGRPGYGPPGRPSWPGQPGYGPPGRPSWPGQPEYGPPGRPPGQGHSGGQQAPSSPPPNTAPAYPSNQLYAVDPGAIRGCLYRQTYIWLSRRQGFWFYPVYVGRTSVAGYRWRNRQRRWEYTGIDLDRIERFSCY